MLCPIMTQAINFHGATSLGATVPAAQPTCKGYEPARLGQGVCRREGSLVDSQDSTP